MSTQNTTLNDPISGNRAERLASDLQHQKSRLVIKEVVEECIGSTDFAHKVKDILLDALEADPARNKLKEWIIDLAGREMTNEATKNRLDAQIDSRIEKEHKDRGWKNKNFWVPTIISSIAAVAAVIAIFTK